jgi:hypothetical protein
MACCINWPGCDCAADEEANTPRSELATQRRTDPLPTSHRGQEGVCSELEEVCHARPCGATRSGRSEQGRL